MCDHLPDNEGIRERFDELRKTDKAAAVTFLAESYGFGDLDQCEIAVAPCDPSPSHHARTKGGHGEEEGGISLTINEAYFDRQADSWEGYVKLLHTIGHELQHVSQRTRDGWRELSEKEEREFLAYSWELTEASDIHAMPELEGKSLRKTIDRVRSNYGKMNAEAKQRAAARISALKAKGIVLDRD